MREKGFLVEGEVCEEDWEKGMRRGINEVVVDGGKVGDMIELEVYMEEMFGFCEGCDGVIIWRGRGWRGYWVCGGGGIVRGCVDGIRVVGMLGDRL